MIPNIVNLPAKVAGIRRTDHGEVLDDTILTESF